MNGVGYGITPFMGASGILARSSGGGGVPFVNEYSMTFDGVSDYFEGSSTFSELDGQSQFSLSMWIKPDALDTIRVLFHIQKNTSAAASQVLVFLRNNGVLDISADVSSKYCRSQVGSIQAGVWNHVLICFDLSQGSVANKIRPFVNGVDVYDTSNGLGTSFVTSTGPIHLGEEANGWQAPFLGKMDEVSLWNSDQRANVSDIYNGGLPFDLSTLGTPPDHWYRMGDNDVFNTNWTLFDNVGSYDLTSTTFPEEARLPISPNSYSLSSFVFDGTDFVTMGNPADLQITGSITLSAWVKTSYSADVQVIIGKDGINTGQRSYLLNVGTSGIPAFYIFTSSGQKNVQGLTTINDGNWHHIMAVNDGTDLKIYIDGTLNNTTVGGGDTMLNGAIDFNIGRRQATSAFRHFFVGNIDEVYVWDNDQSGNISTIYGNGVPTDISSLNPLGHWRFGETDTFSTSWTFVDQGSGGNDGTSTTFPESAKTGDQPYVI